MRTGDDAGPDLQVQDPPAAGDRLLSSVHRLVRAANKEGFIRIVSRSF